MSFDWLNVPGLSSEDNVAGFGSDSSQPPPNVSFNFGAANVNPIQEPRPTLQSDPSRSKTNQGHASNDVNGLGGSQQAQLPNGVQYHTRESQSYQQYQQQYMQERPQPYSQPVQKTQQTHQHKHISHPPNQHAPRGHLTQPTPEIQDDYRETSDDLKVPLSLSHSQLTKDEVQNYLRWYNYITARTHAKLVRLGDVFNFLSNFNLPEKLKVRVTSIFRTCKNALNIGQFFAVLRLISKSLLEGIIPVRSMILQKAPIPKPQPILCIGAKQETYEEVEEETETDSREGVAKVDFDSFASMLLTGNKPGSKKRLRRKIANSTHKNKKVRFAEKVTFQDPPSEIANAQGLGADGGDDEDAEALDFSLPMDQLLKRMAKQKEKNSALISQLPNEQHETEEEKEVLEDMKDSLSHFKQIQTPDMAGVPEQVVGMMANDIGDGDSNGQQRQQMPLQPLKPTSTGSANYLFRSQFPPTAPGGVGSGAAQQAPGELQPLKPTATGSANHLVRSHFPSDTIPMNMQNSQQQEQQEQQLPNTQLGAAVLPPLKPTATGSANYLMKQQFDTQPMNTGQLPMNTGHPLMNTGQHPINIGSIISPVASPEGVSSPPNTNQYLALGKMQQSQQHLPYHEPILQQQNSPQPTNQNQNLLTAPNPASNYFHSLLSHSPSPSQGNLSVPNSHSNLNLPNTQHTSSPYLSSSNVSAQPTASHPHVIYNNGYQYHSPAPQQQQQQQQQQISHQQQPPSQLPQYYPSPQQHMQYPQGYANSISPMNGQGAYGMPSTVQSRGGDIIGDLHTLQQQVDALQNVYGRR